MMKSFFKKLAVVMALAMVVSMVAPAGSALAAEAGITLQGTKTVVKTWELDKVGATVDFAFAGAPKDWKTTTKWTSSDVKVATVDKDGIVKAVAPGTATITITSGAAGTYKHSVKVTVKEAKPAVAFTVTQADLASFTMPVDKKEVKVEDVAVALMINDVEAPIPVKAVTVNGNVATVELYSEFIEGITYKVTYGKNTAMLVGSVGEIDKVSFTYYTEKKGDSVAYVSTDEEPSVTTLEYQLFDANGVNVTSAYDEDEITVEYSIVNEDEDFEVIDNELIFYDAGAAVVEVKVTWTDDEGEEVEKVGNGVVIGMKRPALTHSIVKAGFLRAGQYEEGAIDDFELNADSFFWKNNKQLTSWVLNDEATDTYQFAALVKDNRGNTVVTGINEYGVSNTINDDGEDVYPYGYFKFVTSNDAVVDVDDDGMLSFWEAGVASIITYFVDTTGEDEREVFVGATKITVTPERVPTTYAIAAANLTAASHTAGAGNNADFVLTVFDQYGKNIAFKGGEGSIKVETTSTADDIPVKDADAEYSVNRHDFDGDGVGETSCSGWWCGNSKGGVHYHIVFDGDDFAEYLGTKNAKSVQYAVTIDKEEEDTITTSGTSKIKVTVKDTEDYAADLAAKNTTKYYYKVSGGENIDLAISYVKNFSRTNKEAVVKSKDISMKYLDKSGFEMLDVPADNIVELVEDQKTGEAGKLYYEVSVPKNAVNYSVAKGNGKVTFSWNADVAGDLGYATTGAYKLTVYYVKNTSDEALSKLGTYVFNVSNSQSEPKFAGYDKDLGNKTEKDLSNTEDIIKENLVFTLDGNKIDWTEAGYELIFDEDDKDVVVTAKKIRVNRVTIKVPVDDNNDATNYFYEKEIKVGKTIYADVEED